MDLKKISKFIKQKRNELGITQNELAEKLFVTEKAISRWETGRGTPDISLLLPLAKELKIDVSELLNGEESKTHKDNIEQLIEYNKITKNKKYNIQFKFVVSCYIISILLFLFYLRFEYESSIELNYFIRLLFVIISSSLIIIGNKIYSDKCVELIEDKLKIKKLSLLIVFIYYIVFLFNIVIFARYINISGYNLIPFKTVIDIINSGNIYIIVINTFGNLIVFMPLEYFIIELFNIKKFKICLIISLSIILLIELLQYIFKIGVFDIDDILISFTGMLLFNIIYSKIKKRLVI